MTLDDTSTWWSPLRPTKPADPLADVLDAIEHETSTEHWQRADAQTRRRVIAAYLLAWETLSTEQHAELHRYWAEKPC